MPDDPRVSDRYVPSADASEPRRSYPMSHSGPDLPTSPVGTTGPWPSGPYERGSGLRTSCCGTPPGKSVGYVRLGPVDHGQGHTVKRFCPATLRESEPGRHTAQLRRRASSEALSGPLSTSALRGTRGPLATLSAALSGREPVPTRTERYTDRPHERPSARL
jgi:hypothetical protein